MMSKIGFYTTSCSEPSLIAQPPVLDELHNFGYTPVARGNLRTQRLADSAKIVSRVGAQIGGQL